MRCALSIALLLGLTCAGLLLVPDAVRNPPGAEAWAGPAADLTDFMLVAHGQKGLWSQMSEVAKGASIDDKAWKTMQARANVLVYLGETILAKAKPEKGDAASWKAKSNEYLAMVRALARSAGEKDAAAVKSELTRISKGCDGCHKVHR
jgi:hypothetical protein